jgi:autotransporter translocation and assembly factor TamB
VAVRQVRVARPFVVLVRGPDGRWNVESLMPGAPGQVAAPAAGERLRGEVRVAGGTVQVLDAPGRLRLSVRDLQAVGRLADLPLLRLDASATVVAGKPARVQASGWVDTQEQVADVDVRFQGVAVQDWFARLFFDPRWRWESGWVSGRLRLYGSVRSPQVDGRVQLDGVGLYLVRERLRVRATGPVDLAGRWVTVRSVRVQAGSATVEVSGELRLVGGGAVDLDVRFRGADPAEVRRLVGRALPVRGRVDGRVQVEGPIPAVRVRAQLVAPRLWLAGEPVRDAAARLEYASGTVAVPAASARVRGGRVRGDAVVALGRSPRVVATAELDHVEASASSALGVRLPVEGQLTGQLLVAGPLPGVALAGVLGGGAGEVLGQPVERWHAAFEYSDGDVQIHAGRARGGGTSLSLWGRAGERDLRLQVAARGVRLEEVARFAGLALPASGSVDLVGRVEGPARAPRFSGTVRAAAGLAGPVRWDEAVAELQASRDRVRLVDLRWRDGPDLYRAEGTVDLVRHDARLRLEAAAARVERLVELLGLSAPLRGEFRARLELAGSLRDPVVSGTVDLWDLRTPAVGFSRAAGRWSWKDGVLTLEEGWLHSEAFDLRVSGSAGTAGGLQLDFSADRVRLDGVPQLHNPFVRLQGEVRVQGRVSGDLQAPRVDAQVSGEGVRVNGQRFDTLDGQVRWAASVLELVPLRLQRRASAYTLEGRVQLADEPVVDLVLGMQDAQVRTLLDAAGLFVDADGHLSGRLALAGPASRPRAEAELQVTDGVFRGYRFPSGRGRAVLEGGRVELQEVELVAGRGRLRAQGTVDLGGDSEVEVAGLGLEASAISTLARLRAPLVGTLDFTLQLSGRIQDPTAGLALDARGLGVSEASVDRVTAQAIYRDGFLELEQMLAEQGGQRVRARGRLPLRLRELAPDPEGPVDFVASTDRADLGILRLLPFVEAAEGPFEASFRVQGTVAEPRMEGFVRAEGGRVKLLGLAPPLEGVQVDLGFDHARATLRRFRADLGGGSVEATGEADFGDLRLQGYRVRASARGARVEFPPYLRAVVDGTAEVTGSRSQARLAGRISLSSGELVALAPPPRGGSSGGLLLPIELDLDLAAGEGLFVVAGPVRLQAGGGLHVGGTLGRPALSGTVTGRGGEYRAFGTTFVVEEGTAVFQEFRGTEPLISARARTRVGDVTVFVHLSGTPDQMQVRLTSDPDLPYERIVQLLAAQAGIERAAAGEVELALRQQLARFVLGEFEQRLRQLLGLAELRIEYDFEKPLRLRLGRFLLPDLYLTLTTVFDSETRFLWALEYRFARHYALAFSHDTAGVWMVLLRANFTW